MAGSVTFDRVGIIGLGYVGIPLSLRISEVGKTVLGFDIDPGRVAELNAGKSAIKHIPDAEIAAMRAAGFEATTDFSRAGECDALVICVPTPLNKFREPDLSFIVATMDTIAPYLRKGQMISLESTTWPGTTDEVLKPYLDAAGLMVGEDVFLVYSPEREDPGNAHFTTRTIPKVVGGHTPACLAAGVALYEAFIDRVVPVSSTRLAELVKLLENIQRSVNIGLMNEMKVVADAMGLNLFEAVDAAATKPFGFTPYYPGPGIGGHCIPIDPFYLTWKAREYGLHTRFIELAGEINAGMPQYVVERLIRVLSDNGKPLGGSKILVLGIAYKPGVSDVRASPSIFIMEKLREWGASIAYSDPHVPVFPRMREHRFDLASVEVSREALKTYDAVLLLTDHSEFDYDLIADHSKIVVDTRGRLSKDLPNVVYA
ncbi:MAG: nucleotide sugar dehydrogenase [Roseovarius sp.]